MLVKNRLPRFTAEASLGTVRGVYLARHANQISAGNEVAPAWCYKGFGGGVAVGPDPDSATKSAEKQAKIMAAEQCHEEGACCEPLYGSWKGSTSCVQLSPGLWQCSVLGDYDCLDTCPKPEPPPLKLPEPVKETGKVVVVVVAVGWVAWEIAKWAGGIVLAPETGGASLAGAAALP